VVVVVTGPVVVEVVADGTVVVLVAAGTVVDVVFTVDATVGLDEAVMVVGGEVGVGDVSLGDESLRHAVTTITNTRTIRRVRMQRLRLLPDDFIICSRIPTHQGTSASTAGTDRR
jgi:hypothetical protein